MVHDIGEAKRLLRQEVLAHRRSLSAKENKAFSERIAARLLALDSYREAQTIFAFASMADEVQLYGFMESALAAGKSIAVPLVTGKGSMEAARVRTLADLVPGDFGILTVRAVGRVLFPPESLDLVLVPGAAFSREGARLGLGAGFYDRFLSERAPAAQRIAVAFSCQITATVPVEPHDMMMQQIVTEKEIIRCR